MSNLNERVNYAKLTNDTVAYDSTNDMFKVSSMQKKFRDSFGGSSLDTNKWTSAIGSGGSIVVSGGQVTIASGTTINSDTYILSKDVFTVPFKLSIGMTISQRIANQVLYVEAISVDPVTLAPDGKHCASFVFDGTTATQGKYRVQNSAITPLDSALVTIPTTASGSFYEIEPFGDECWFHGGTIDSTNGRTNSYRRHQQIPDPNALYKIRVRLINSASAPASSTSVVIQYVACQDYAELTAEITSGRGNAVAGQGIYATVGGAVSVSGTATITPTNPTQYLLNSLATTNAVNIKATAGTVYSIIATNKGASPRYLKLYNIASAPTVGTTVPILDIPLPIGITTLELGTMGVRLGTGISIAITGAVSDTDATVIGAGDVKLAIAYI